MKKIPKVESKNVKGSARSIMQAVTGEKTWFKRSQERFEKYHDQDYEDLINERRLIQGY